MAAAAALNSPQAGTNEEVDDFIDLRYRYPSMKGIQALLSITRTDATWWYVPTRVLIGLMLIIPLQGLSEFLSVCDSRSACAGVRLIEIVLGGSLIGGLLVRIGGWLAVADFGIRALAGFAASFLGEGSTLFGLVEPYGDWVWGPVYLGTVTLLLDINSAGGGTFSADRFIHHWLSARFVE